MFELNRQFEFLDEKSCRLLACSSVDFAIVTIISIYVNTIISIAIIIITINRTPLRKLVKISLGTTVKLNICFLLAKVIKALFEGGRSLGGLKGVCSLDGLLTS